MVQIDSQMSVSLCVCVSVCLCLCVCVCVCVQRALLKGQGQKCSGQSSVGLKLTVTKPPAPLLILFYALSSSLLLFLSFLPLSSLSGGWAVHRTQGPAEASTPGATAVWSTRGREEGNNTPIKHSLLISPLYSRAFLLFTFVFISGISIYVCLSLSHSLKRTHTRFSYHPP